MKLETNDGNERFIVVQAPEQRSDDEIDLLGLINIIFKWWKFSVPFVFICVVVSVMVALLLPKIYKSEAVLMTVSDAGRNMQNNGLAGLIVGMGLPFNLSSTGGKGDQIMNILESRSLKERLIQKYELLPLLFPAHWDEVKEKWKVEASESAPSLLDGVRKLGKLFEVQVNSKKPGLISLIWKGEDPDFCSLMLKRVINEVKQYLDVEYISEAKRTRIFVERQLDKAEQDMTYWEQKIPEETLTKSEILLEREVSLQVYKQLRQQLETVKIDEAKEMIQFKVLDPPFIPEKPYRPRKRIIVIMAFVTSCFAGMFLSLLFEYITKHKEKLKSGTNVQAAHCGKQDSI